jgi:hypothetical protein
MNKTELISKFLELCQYTYPFGTEDDLVNNYLSEYDLIKDSVGNYYTIIGDSDTMFCSHLDTVGKYKSKVNFEYNDHDGHIFIYSDKESILGADDKAGVVIMLNMIDNNIPGLYYFFIGEENHLYGSKLISKTNSNFFSKYKKCIAFDRKGYNSIISKQLGGVCCSDEFCESLILEFSNNGLEFYNDKTGIYCDSLSFMGLIPECTNISVGYFNEHTYDENQNLDFLVSLAEAVLLVNWKNLIIVRKPKPSTYNVNENVITKFKNFR